MTWPEYRFGDVQLEMSLKPYFDTSEATARRVAAELFTQWLPLCRHAWGGGARYPVRSEQL